MTVDDSVGAVLVHGFTATPFEMSYLAWHLENAGVATTTPALPGHATTPADLAGRRFGEWVDTVSRAVDAMVARHARTYIVGQSLGGLLALEQASRRRDLAGVVSLAAPLWLTGLAKHASRFPVAYLPKLGGPDIRDRHMKAQLDSYPVVPTRALRELVAFMPVVDAVLPRIQCPVLVMHARDDHTAPVACARRIQERVPQARVRILLHSFHLISLDVERDIVASEVKAFVKTSPT